MSKSQNPPLTGVLAAVRSLDAIGVRGSQAMLAKEIGVTRAAVQNWKQDGKIPLIRLPRVAEVTGLKVAVLRPDYQEAFLREMGVDAEEFFKVFANKKRKPSSN